MNIEELTIKELREIAKLAQGLLGVPACAPSVDHPYTIGQNYLIRCVTHYYTGRLVEVYEHELVIEDAAWVADTGRFADALMSGVLREVEPYPDGRVVIGRGAVLDACEWGDLPREQK